MQARSATASKISASFITLEEGFQQFGNDLNKLQVRMSCRPCPWALADDYQQFIELNATAFSKILKKVGDRLS
jgi:CDK inhibitor PHO81